ncbi:hypothetical protein HYPDE_26158 [Hyphomicrobium denitrificans 1NES1]|uniref:Uncharacterized protein n=1 Tax=Hyphomicrobium denitrificans 1NES1 TaxID=670307 RepID=N0B0E3_9HYPH|nr:hypothetical protein HYPDE_26158 [Hyphomicrobium denitrificans 1NES1]
MAGLGSVGGFAGADLAGNGPDGFYVRTAFAATAGGLAAEITGGKFSNGAITASFARLFNDERGLSGTQSGIDERAFEARTEGTGLGHPDYDILEFAAS